MKQERESVGDAAWLAGQLDVNRRQIRAARDDFAEAARAYGDAGITPRLFEAFLAVARADLGARRCLASRPCRHRRLGRAGRGLPYPAR